MPILVPERKRKYHDPNTAPVSGRRGPCALCGAYSQLTEAHILPRAAGNTKDLLAHSFLASSSGEDENLLARRFRNGLSFWTLCKDCNSRLGSNEDKEITSFYDRVGSDLGRGVILPSPLRYVVRPNLLIRGILAHTASANDTGARTLFDTEVQEIFLNRKTLQDSRLRIYYWPYIGDRQIVIRDVAVFHNFFSDPMWLQVLKMPPLGFAITDRHTMLGRPCLNMYRVNRDQEEMEIPLYLEHLERHPHWPASPGDRGSTLFSSRSTGLVAMPR